MRRVLLLILTLVFLLTASVAGANNAFSLTLPGGSLPAIAARSSVSSINYTTLSQLNKPDQPKSSLLFGVVSDVHVQSTNPIAQNKFQQMLADMVKLHVPNLVINGDLGDGDPQDYETLDSLVKQQKNHPTIYYTIGNHEFYQAYHNPISKAWSPETFPNGETDDAALNRFLNFTNHSKV